MKGLFLHIAWLLLMGLVVLTALPARAQDEFSRETPRETADEILPESDSKSNTKIQTSATPRDTSRDSVFQKSSPAFLKKAENKPQPEEDILSYNFLYYLIQRFKSSDIVD
jgi:hypothetical protein